MAHILLGIQNTDANKTQTLPQSDLRARQQSKHFKQHVFVISIRNCEWSPKEWHLTQCEGISKGSNASDKLWKVELVKKIGLWMYVYHWYHGYERRALVEVIQTTEAQNNYWVNWDEDWWWGLSETN